MLSTKILRIAYQHLKNFRYPKLAADSSKYLLNTGTKVTKPEDRLVFNEKRLLQLVPSMQWNCTRNFHRPEDEDENHPSPVKTIQKIVPHSARAVRLANENGYLSWCRNAYICSVVAVGITQLSTTCNGNLLLQYAATGAMFVSFLNLLAGTTSFIVQLLALKQTVGMTMFSTLLFMSFAILHLCAWSFVIFLFISHPDNDIVVIEIEKQDNKSE